MTFEELVKRLDEIVEQLESGDTKLEEINKLFAEGAQITKQCYEMLIESKGKITVLREEVGKFIEKPMSE